MADISKAEKLAAARRKLKEFQQKTKESSGASLKHAYQKEADKAPSSEAKITAEENSVFDSGPVPVNHVLKESTENVDEHTENHVGLTQENFLPVVSLENIFPNTSTIGNTVADLHILNGGEVSVEDKPQDNNVGPVELGSKVLFLEDSNHSNFFEQYAPSKTATFPSSQLSNMFAANNFFDQISSFASTSVPQQSNVVVVSETDGETQRPSIELSQANDAEGSATSGPVSITDGGGNVEEREDLVAAPGPSEDGAAQLALVPEPWMGTEPAASPGRSSTESLRQLSHQINDLIGESDADAPPGGESWELEKRNQELAAMLGAERQRSEQLRQQLKEYQTRAGRLQVVVEEVRTEGEARLARETGPLREQLQLHAQTLGLLVGEKTELQAALTATQHSAKMKAAENEELQGRVKQLRQQLADLEKELGSVSEGARRQEAATMDLQREVDKLRVEQKLARKQLEEAEEEASELRQRLQSRTAECAALRDQCQEKQSQLALAQLRVHQLSAPDGVDLSGQLEVLHQQNVSLERQVAELQQVARAAAAERDQAGQQYQQYVQQLNSQLHSIAAKLEAVTTENERLTGQEQTFVRHISELEKQLQLQAQRKQEPMPTGDVARDLQERLDALKAEKQGLADTLETQEQEMQRLRAELEERSTALEEASSWAERLRSNQPDQEKLLAAMESDKVAAARAVSQNHQLKQQLEELQDGFVKMSNDKLELTERLQQQQHVVKELGDKLAQQESQLQDLREAAEQKDLQIDTLEQSSRELSTQVLQHHQIADRMRHYEAQGHFSDLLQQELATAKEHVEKLTAQNSDLRALLAQSDAKSSESVQGGPEEANDRRDTMVAALSASVSQLEMERNRLQEQLMELQNKPAVAVGEGEGGVAGSEVLKQEYETMKQAMEQLEARFASKMRDVAELSDEKQRLEHLVLQLQGETETIGEYIALYQVQRSILRQRAQEKDEQLSKLSRDREELKTKLDSLNVLVQDLLANKERRDRAPPRLQGIPNGVVGESDTVTETDAPKLVDIAPQKDVPAEKHTAQKIMELLTEIKSTNLIDPQGSENFHPCPWCSGQLKNV